jgi:ornithine cyclodeaminase/alanine dehydrogenase-like protein (mu-crystallin family)
VTNNLDPRALVARLGEAFKTHSLRRQKRSLPQHHQEVGGGSLSSSAIGSIEGIPAYAIKVETRVPSRSPPLEGFVHLFDQESGRLLAVLESSFISGIGSALTGALATDLLAAPTAKSVAVIGNGTQGWLGLRFLMEMRALEEVTLFDLNRRKSLRIAQRLEKYEDLSVKVCDSLSGAVSNADIICCSTWSRQPFLFSEMVKPGAHISTLGADEVGKMELSKELLQSCSFFCDDRELAVAVGPLHGLERGKEFVMGELGEILAAKVAGRRSPEEITVYGAVGLPFVDLIASWVAYRKALQKRVGKYYEPLK